MVTNYAVVDGNLSEGYRIVGPFQSWDAAHQFAELNPNRTSGPYPLTGTTPQSLVPPPTPPSPAPSTSQTHRNLYGVPMVSPRFNVPPLCYTGGIPTNEETQRERNY